MKNTFLTFLFIFALTSFFFQDVVSASRNVQNNQVDNPQKTHRGVSKNLQNNQLDLPKKTHKRKKIHKNYDARLEERKKSSKLVSKKLNLIKKHNVKKKYHDKS